MISGIYCIENIENGKQYIGKGKNVEKRMNSSHEGCPYIYNALKKYGKDAFKCYPIEYCEIEELFKREQYYIKEWNTKVPNGYNLTDGGEGSLGCFPSDETKEKIRVSTSGENNHNYGKSLPNTTKKLISKNHRDCKGKKQSYVWYKW